MPRPRLIRAFAYHRAGPNHAAPGLPTRTMWVRRVPDGEAALAGHPIFQLAPLHPSMRELMLRPWEQERILRDARLAEDGPSEVLIWSPDPMYFRTREYTFAEPPGALYDPYYFLLDRGNVFTPYQYWVGMTKDRVWMTGGGERDYLVLGAYVHLVERLDVNGDRLPAEPQEPIPDEDVGPLEWLVP